LGSNDGIRITNYTAGKGSPIIFLHGWLHSGKIWDQMLPLAKSGYKLIAPDLPGFGDSEPISKNGQTFELFSEAVYQFLLDVSENDKPPVIIADSLSAVVMLQLLSSKQFQCEKVFLLGCPSNGLPGIVKVLRRFTPFQTLITFIQRQPKNLLRVSLRYGNFLTMYNRSGYLTALVEAFKSSDPYSAINLFDAILEPISETTYTDIPATIIRGKHDRIVTRKSSEKLAVKLNAGYVEVEGAGHTPMIEKPDTLIQVIQKQLRFYGKLCG